MNSINRCGLLLATVTLSINAWATELNTEEQKLGYIIGMDIGKSLKRRNKYCHANKHNSALKMKHFVCVRGQICGQFAICLKGVITE